MIVIKRINSPELVSKFSQLRNPFTVCSEYVVHPDVSLIHPKRAP